MTAHRRYIDMSRGWVRWTRWNHVTRWHLSRGTTTACGRRIRHERLRTVPERPDERVCQTCAVIATLNLWVHGRQN
jgi:hypothetical protein